MNTTWSTPLDKHSRPKDPTPEKISKPNDNNEKSDESYEESSTTKDSDSDASLFSNNLLKETYFKCFLALSYGDASLCVVLSNFRV